jgi:aryl-alcohol dehydrogenase-like predicted oxidoreductase
MSGLQSLCCARTVAMNEIFSLGTAQFGLNYGIANKTGKINSAAAQNILNFAKASGINTIDTAIDYGNSEIILGDAGVKKWQIGTKLPNIPEDCLDIAAWCHENLKKSISNLKIDQLESVLLHRPQQLLGPRGDDIYRALEKIKSSGIVKKIGISIYAPDELEIILEHYKIDQVQAPCNILDQSIVTSGWAKRLHDMSIDLHVRSAFLQGLLVMPVETRPFTSAAWKEIWSIWDGWVQRESLTPLEACLRYVRSIPQIAKVIVGVDHVQQLQSILAINALPLKNLPNWPKVTEDIINPAKWKR